MYGYSTICFSAIYTGSCHQLTLLTLVEGLTDDSAQYKAHGTIADPALPTGIRHGTLAERSLCYAMTACRNL